MFLWGKICVLVRVGKSSAKCLFSVLKIDPNWKYDICGYIWHRSFIQTVKYSFLTKKSFIKDSMVRCSCLAIFYYSEKLCIRQSRRDLQDVLYCLRPCWKNYISGYIWHKSFIQTVKCSFSNQIIVYQSFCGELLTLSYFLLQVKVLCFSSHVGKSVTWEMFISIVYSVPKKLYLWLYLTQIVHSNSKCSFFNQTIGYQSFYGGLLTFSFFFYFKSSVFQQWRRQVTDITDLKDVYWNV